MAAATSKPEEQLLRPSFKDEENMAWFASSTEGDVGRLHSGALERGGSFSVVEHDKTTDRQRRQAARQRGIMSIRSLMSVENLATIDCYWHPGCDRLRVERERENEQRKAAGQTLLSPHSDGERGLRLAALGPFTQAAQAAGEAMVNAERLRDRAKRMKASHLRLVGDPVLPVPVEGGEGVTPLGPDGGQVVSEALAESLAETHPKPGENALHFLVRRDAALCEAERQKVQGPWKPPALAPDQLRDAAVRAIRDAERRKDVQFLSTVRVQAARAYALAGDAYVRARRAVKGKDGEERRQEAADRWTLENTVARRTAEIDMFVEALESSSRLRTS